MTSIWEFAVGFYARPGVEAACLSLQARGVEVTTLLAILWAEATQRPVLLPEDFARIEARAGVIQREVIVPLRRARIALNPLTDEPARAALRDAVKRIELDAERHVLEAIGAILPTPTGQPGAAQENLMAYPATAALLPDPDLKFLVGSLREWRKSAAV